MLTQGFLTPGGHHHRARAWIHSTGEGVPETADTFKSLQAVRTLKMSARGCAKYLTYLTRHGARDHGLRHDEHGWIDIDDIMELDRVRRTSFCELLRDRLLQVVEAAGGIQILGKPLGQPL